MFPSIGEIGSEFLNFFSGKGMAALGMTLVRLIGSLIVSFIISVLISYLYFLFKPSINLFKPLMFILKVSPIIAIILYIQVLTASVNESAPFIVTTLMLIPIMTDAYVSGIDNIEKGVLDSLELETTNRSYKFYKVIFPMISQNIALSMFQSVGLGIKVVIMVEYFCFIDTGLGGILNSYYTNINIAGLLSTIVFVSIIAAIIELSIYLVKKKVLKNN